jgi:hypothetical protein
MGNRQPATGNWSLRSAVLCALAWATLATLGGCGSNWNFSRPSASSQPVPAPLDMLLPKSISFQGFTGGPKALPPNGDRGIEVQMAAKDAFGDATKAFGTFRFELYDFRKNSSDPKGERLGVWEVSVLEPAANRKHWNEVHRTYAFQLGYGTAVPVGNKLVLVAVFSSPFSGERLFAQHIFVAGE